VVIIGVDDGESALSEGDSAECIAEAETTPSEHETNDDSFEPDGDFDFEGVLDNSHPCNRRVVNRLIDSFDF